MSNTPESQSKNHKSIHPHPAIRVAVEDQGILIIHEEQKRRYLVRYPEAALWDLLSREISYDRILTMMSVLTGLDRPQTEAFVIQLVRKWVKQGILVRTI